MSSVETVSSRVDEEEVNLTGEFAALNVTQRAAKKEEEEEEEGGEKTIQQEELEECGRVQRLALPVAGEGAKA
jgi:hypothetical protein